MAIRLFDIKDHKVIATEHCYTIDAFKNIIDSYPKEYNKIFAYLFYMSSLNDEENPFANVPEEDKEDLILKSIGGSFSVDDKAISKALDLSRTLHETPTYRMYLSIKVALDKLGKYLRETAITDGRDGNILAIQRVAKEYNDVCTSFNARYKEFKEESSRQARGGNTIAYDQ